MKKNLANNRKPTRRVHADETGIRKFCIEMAAQWPTVPIRCGTPSPSASAGYAETARDADLIERARKIYNFMSEEVIK